VHFVGIDLAWSPRNRSGGAVLSATGQLQAVTADLTGDDSVLRFILSAIPPGKPGIVAIDAPLAVPNETGGRPCDQQVAAVFGRFEAAPYPANRRNLSRYGGLRAECIRQRLESDGFCHDPFLKQHARTRWVIEVFPHPATVSLFHFEKTLKYKARQGREYSLRWHELGRLRDCLAALAKADPPLYLSDELLCSPIEGLRGRSFKSAEDVMDAIVCAYTGLYAWHHGPRGYIVFGEVTNGHILVPMTPSMWERSNTGSQ